MGSIIECLKEIEKKLDSDLDKDKVVYDVSFVMVCFNDILIYS